MSLSCSDYKDLLEVIELAYSIPDRMEMLQAICEKLHEIIPISTAVFAPADSQTGRFIFEQGYCFNHKPKDLLQYALYYAPLDPLAIDKWISRYDNTVIRNTDIMSPIQLADSEFGRDFLPQVPLFYCLCTTLGSQGDPVGALGLHRRKHQRDFTDREKEILRLFSPHLSRALHTLRLMDTISECQGLGMIFTGVDGRCSYMNPEARRALGEKPITAIPDPGLSMDSVLFQSDTGVYRVRTLPVLTNGRNSENFSSKVSPQSHARKTGRVILLEPIPARWSLKARFAPFGLSPRQEEIASLVLQGHSNREIAERLFIAEQTVKDHLHDIFEKMRVRRRSELVAKILKIPGYDM